MKIAINLATRPFADLGPILKRLQIAMAVFAMLSIGFGIGLHYLHSKAEAARARERAVDAQITKINQERQGYQAMMRQPDNALVLQEANNLNALFDQKAFSWTLAMEDLETVLPGGVQVTTLEPVRDEKTGQITLKLRVVGPRDKGIELVQNLEHSHHFLHPAIVGESIESNGGPNQPMEPVSTSNRVNFELNAEYNPATFGELPANAKAVETSKSEPGSSEPGSSESGSSESGSAAAAAAPVRKPGVPAAGPGLRRPPATGGSKPAAAHPGVTRPPGASMSPNAVRPPAAAQSASAALQSPQAMRQAGQPRYQVPPQGQAAPDSQQTPTRQPVRPGGQQ
jgi:type IV pilus assembly protein PilN